MIAQSSQNKWRALMASLPMLKRYVRRLTGDEEHANEILQEVSLRVLATECPEEPARHGAWVRGVARQVLAHDRRMRRRAHAEQPFEEELLERFIDRAADPEAHIDARASVKRIVGDLDSEGLELLYRRYVLQESGRELADVHASSPAAMRMRLMRLRNIVAALARSARDALAFATTLSAAVLDWPLA
jgi:DNA-directed RNA polymerase specialized sigma24 family protein